MDPNYIKDIETLLDPGHVGISGMSSKYGLSESQIRASMHEINGTGKVWKDSIGRLRRGLVEKHGDVFLTDLESLDTVQFWNLTEMGKKYGITREYVRQIYKKINKKPFGPVKKRKTKKRNEEMSCVNDPRYKAAEYDPRSAVGKGAVGEKLFYEECVQRGFKIDLLCDRAVDIKINGFYVDVKYSMATGATNMRSPRQLHSYGISKKQCKFVDFFACYHPQTSSFFIVPNRWKNSNKAKTIYIPEEPSSYYCAKNAVFEFQNAWHLLEAQKIKRG